MVVDSNSPTEHPVELADSAAPLTVAAVDRGVPTEVIALGSVMSTPTVLHGAATTSISRSSIAETCTRANVLSVGTPAKMWTSGSVSSENVVLAAALASGLGQEKRKA